MKKGLSRKLNKKTIVRAMMLTAALCLLPTLAACGNEDTAEENPTPETAQTSETSEAAETTSVSDSEDTTATTPENSATATVENPAKQANGNTTAAVTNNAKAGNQTAAKPQNTAKSQNTAQATANKEQTFTGILICQDCSNVPDPTIHDLPCMLMYSCRDTGYGIDIKQSDGSYKFYMFDSAFQDDVWNYLTNCTRMDHLYVTVKGTWDGNVIHVKSMKEY